MDKSFFFSIPILLPLERITMDTTPRKKVNLWWLPALALPTAGIALFYLLRDHRPLMNRWVHGFMAPVEQFLGRVWSVFPFSVAELIVATAITAIVVWLMHALVLLIRQHRPKDFLRRMLALVATALWIWCGLCWMWNPSYYAETFTEKSGLSSQGHSPQALAATTAWFACNTAQLSTQIPRDGEGHFSLTRQEALERGVDIYDNLVEEFPFLKLPSVKAKPLVFSRLQSILGFTGMYFPFTGEANVNVDAPPCLLPATIAHEMAHQRMVASELEANFVGIAAAITSDDVVFQYSGYLQGLISLSNALHGISPETWDAIQSAYFTPELVTDWNDNYYYWKALDSAVEEQGEQIYDAFLKSNDQVLGIASYGACVDLLITYFEPEIKNTAD